MKKIKITPKSGQIVRLPLFTTLDDAKRYLSGTVSASDLGDRMMLVELNESDRRCAIVEWRGIAAGPNRSPKHWPRLIRGVIARGNSDIPEWAPFAGWCHPQIMMFINYEDDRATYVRCDDDVTVDLDAIFEGDAGLLLEKISL